MSEFKFRTNPGLSQSSFEQPGTVSDSRGGGNPIQKHVRSPKGRGTFVQIYAAILLSL